MEQIKTFIKYNLSIFYILLMFINNSYSNLNSIPLIDLDKKGVYLHFREGKVRIIFWCRIYHSDGVPNAIKNVYVICPDKQTKFNIPYYPDESKNQYDGIYEIHYDYSNVNNIQEGLYTFVVVDSNNNYNFIYDNFFINIIEPIEVNQMSPKYNEYLELLNPIFSWTVRNDNVSYYMIKIYDDLFSTVHKGITNNSFYNLPKGILGPSDYYRYNVESFGELYYYEIDSNARSPAATLDAIIIHTPNYAEEAPAISNNFIGVSSLTSRNKSNLLLHILVRSHLNVPNGLKTVEAKTPSNTYKMEYKKKISKNEGIYETVLNQEFLKEGYYTFIATDINGESGSYTEFFNPQNISKSEFTTITPYDGNIISTNKPFFTWNSIKDAKYYYIYIYDYSKKLLIKLLSENNYYKIATDLFSNIGMYYWKIDAITSEENENINSIRTSASIESEYFFFGINNLYDLDNNNQISLSDLKFVTDKWNYQLFEKNFETIYDVNRDNVINLFDIMSIAQQIESNNSF